MTLNLAKCCFCKEKIEYLGFEITIHGIAPGKRKTEAIREFPTPENTKQVRSFVELASYFRRFVKGFAILARPMTELLKGERKFEWGSDQARAFSEIKERLTHNPILSVYNPAAETEVHTDACSLGIGGVLLQKQTDNKLHPVSYFSRKTTREESMYHSYELEALAIVCTLEPFRVHLIGIRFVIKTDCNSLKLLASKRDLKPRVGRWFVRLSEFDYVIDYQKGECNSVADALSRSPVEEAVETEVVGLPVLGITISTD